MTSSSERPRRVVVVDADNPLVEVQGEFFWREDHERLLAVERDRAYDRGYADGFAAAAARPQRIVIRRRRPVLRAVLLVALMGLVAFGYVVSLAANLAG